MTQAVIVAGGQGTRLTPVSGGLPKPLVPVGGTPNIERQIALLARYGVAEIFVTTGHGAGLLETRLGDGSRFGVRLHHVREERPLGTAGGVASMRASLRETFFVVYADVVVHMDLASVLDFHRRVAAVATLVVHPNDHPYDSDLVDLDASARVRKLYLKPHPASEDLPNMVSAGLYVLSALALDYIRPDTRQDFVHDVFPRMLDAGAMVAGYRTTEYLKDMGTPERLAQVEHDIETGKVEASHRDRRRSTAFLDRDGVINVEINGVHHPDRLQMIQGAAAAIRRLNQAGWLAACVTNQPDIAKGFVTEEDVERIHRRLESQLGLERAWLDAIVYCPHHPDRGFAGERPDLKTTCTCRKPAPGLLQQIGAVLPVDKGSSVVIGDSWRDMSAAHAFGVDAVGVRTGASMAGTPDEHALDGRPDVMVEDLSEAVALLLDEDPAVQELAQRIVDASESAAQAFVLVLMGGLARAGKSMTAFRLRRDLRARGLRPLWVRLDDWIVPSAVRPPGTGLPDRYRLGDVHAAVHDLLEGRVVRAPGYDPKTRGAVPCPTEYDPRDADVLIVEGVPALLIDIRYAPCIRVQIEAADEAERLERLHALDAFKRLSGDDILALAVSRREEAAAVAAAAAVADVRIAPRLLNR